MDWLSGLAEIASLCMQHIGGTFTYIIIKVTSDEFIYDSTKQMIFFANVI